MTSALRAMERMMRKAMDNDAASDDIVAKRTKTATNVVMMSFFTIISACARNIWGTGTPNKNRPCRHVPKGVKNVLTRAIRLNCNPECGVAFTRVC
jgi:hypothetical protein